MTYDFSYRYTYFSSILTSFVVFLIQTFFKFETDNIENIYKMIVLILKNKGKIIKPSNKLVNNNINDNLSKTLNQ